MAQRRMVSLKIVDTDKFLDMPLSARLLYYDFLVRGDDDGFINSPKKIMNMVGASIDDFKILCAKEYLIPFDSGVVVIRDWRIHNLIRHDRYTETEYKKEKSSLVIENNRYVIPDGNQTAPQVRLGKVRLGKDSIGKDSIGNKNNKNRPISPEEVQKYLTEIGETRFTGGQFYDYYESKGWMIGKNKMVDWKAAVRTWRRNQKGPGCSPDDDPDRIKKMIEEGGREWDSAK